MSGDRILTVREVIEALGRLPPDAPIAFRVPLPMYPDLVAPVRSVEALAGRDFGGYRDLDLVLDEALPRDFAGGAPIVIVVLGSSRVITSGVGGAKDGRTNGDDRG